MAVISYKCPNCDGELIFNPAGGNYKCEYCTSLFSQEELEQLQPAEGKESAEQPDGSGGEAFQDEQSGETQKENEQTENNQEESAQEGMVYTCASCGAQIVTDATTAATFCYYCHNPVILQGRLSGVFLPDKIIPFKITKEAAETMFMQFVGKKKFVPKAFFNKKQIDNLTGVYFPYWVYEADIEASITGNAQKRRVWRTGDIEHTETKFYKIERQGEVHLENITGNALSKANGLLAQGVLPYDSSEMKDFHMGYLSGFQAEKRDIEKTAMVTTFNNEVVNATESLVRDTVSGYSSFNITSRNCNTKDENWKYVLFPVWTVTYKGKNGKMYYYSLNGQTGSVCGELPVDNKKLTLVSVLVALGILVLGVLGGFLLW